jgi:hypothetical protein
MDQQTKAIQLYLNQPAKITEIPQTTAAFSAVAIVIVLLLIVIRFTR